MSNSLEYGPHTTQLKLLAARLSAVSGAEWEALDEAMVVSEACFGTFDWMSFTLVMAGEANEDWCETAEQFTRGAKPESDDYPEAAKSALESLVAVAFADYISPQQFAAGYGPVSALIPVESLGQEPPLPEVRLADLLHERFVSRANGLSVDEWSDVARVTTMVEAAIGERALRNAYNAALKALPNREVAEQVRLGRQLEQAVQAAYAGELESTERVRIMLEEESGLSPEQVTEHVNTLHKVHQDLIETCTFRAQSAMLAVMVHQRLTAQNFSILYLPFATVIPVESIDLELAIDL